MQSLSTECSRFEVQNPYKIIRIIFRLLLTLKYSHVIFSLYTPTNTCKYPKNPLHQTTTLGFFYSGIAYYANTNEWGVSVECIKRF